MYNNRPGFKGVCVCHQVPLSLSMNIIKPQYEKMRRWTLKKSRSVGVNISSYRMVFMNVLKFKAMIITYCQIPIIIYSV